MTDEPVCTLTGTNSDLTWHVHGNRDYHTDPLGRAILELVMRVLPRNSLPITVSSTGYVNISNKVTTHADSWCTDEYGRVVFILNDCLYFQRYSVGQIIMCGHLNNPSHSFSDLVSENAKRELLETLQNKIPH